MMIVDTHVHLYPEADVGSALAAGVQRLMALAPDATPVLCLTERHDCHVYRDICSAGCVPGADHIQVAVQEAGACLVLTGWDGASALYVLPGRQIVTRERMELLCLGRDAAIPDGEPAVQSVRRIREVDGLPVLPWGVGKWMLARKGMVQKVLDAFGPDELLLGDSAMRPWFWREPGLMQTARRDGYRVVAGSDPLPHEPGDAWIGRYASRLEADVDAASPATSIREALGQAPVQRVGQRPGPIGFWRRMMT